MQVFTSEGDEAVTMPFAFKAIGAATDLRCVRRVDEDQPRRTLVRDGFRGVGEIASGPVAHAPVEVMSPLFLPTNDGSEVFRHRGKIMEAAEAISALDRSPNSS
ncbi:MAG: hypothetical protein OXF88_21200 [Rhodobacteraceae bacterium]|nr:hypothetical protein [Paracoccaceae bacterium]MCY4139724.1 hypothetical protein [Paracoccaceae bacterium]